MESEQKRRLLSNAVLLMVTLFSLAAWPALAATITVTNTNDSGPGSLRDAITNAQSGDTVTFSLASYPATITLSSVLDINTNLIIRGPGPSNLAISGNYAVRVLQVASGIAVATSGVTIENGFSMAGAGIYNDGGKLTLTDTTVSGNSSGPKGSAGGGIYNAGGTVTLTNSTVAGNSSGPGGSAGGGIYNADGTVTLTNSTVSGNFSRPAGSAGGIYNADGTVTLTNSTVNNNGAGLNGGGIISYGTLTLTNSAVSGNGSDFNGAGIYCGGTLTLTNSTVSRNGASRDGAGIYCRGTLTLTGSTISGNFSSSLGGGINCDGTVTLTNTTVSGNGASEGGGGIFCGGPLTLINSTVSGNSSGGYGGAPGGISSFGVLALKNTILANNTERGLHKNCFISASSSALSYGHNLSDDNSCSGFFKPAIGDLNNTPAGLDPGGLKDNGGPTQTIALLATSPAVDAIPLKDCTAIDGTTPIATDQRGLPRPQGLGCDIGAYEYLAITAPAPNSSTTCNGAYNGTFSGDIEVSKGQSCIFFNGGVTGNVREDGGSLVLFQSKVGGDVQVRRGGTFSIGPGSTINGNLEIQNLPRDPGQDQVCGSTVGGDLHYQNNGSAMLIGGSPPNPCTGNTIGGNVHLQNNWAPVQVFDNTISGSLHCQNNTEITGNGNVVGQQRQGQCSGF